MLFKTGCKINLGLQILSKREDGYHNISSVFYPVDILTDLIEIVPSDRDGFSSSGITVDCPDEKNLCVIALRHLREIRDVPECRIHLHKNIPFGAGLGAGSANAMGVIEGCNTLFSLGLSRDELINTGAKVGSDVAFFAAHRPQIAAGRGEVLHDVSVNLSGMYIQIAKPEGSVSTKEAYSRITPNQNVPALADLISRPIDCWRDCLKNDFEPSVFGILKDAEKLKDNFYRAGAEYSALSGSGSAVFGIFKSKPAITTDNLIIEGMLQ